VENVLMNSVSVAFIMRIDDMAREAFQSSYVSDHIDGMKFEGTFVTMRAADKDRSEKGKIRPPSWATYKTFWSLEKAVVTLIVTYFCTYPVLWHVCPNGEV